MLISLQRCDGSYGAVIALNDNENLFKGVLLNEGLPDGEIAGLMLGSVHASKVCSDLNQDTRIWKGSVALSLVSSRQQTSFIVCVNCGKLVSLC